MKRLIASLVAAAAALTLSAKDIATPADWNAFAAAVTAGDWSAWQDDAGVVNIVADLEFPRGAANIESTVQWTGILDGHGHTITQRQGKLPLIISIAPSGVVRNLNLAGERRTNHLNGWASLIAVNNAGLVENCHSKVNFNMSGKTANVHGLVRTNTGTVRGCTNSGSIHTSAPEEALWVAGVVTDNQGTLENCANYGSISVEAVDFNATVAGVCLFAKGNISGCVNEGDINVSLNLSDNRVFYCGGLFGRGECRGKDASIRGCRNKGNVRVVRTAQGHYSLLRCGVGGVLACMIDGNDSHHMVLENCINMGSVSLLEDENYFQQAGCFAVGGIVGRVCPNGGKESYMAVSEDGYYMEIRGCRNTGTIQQATALRFTIAFEKSPSGARFAYTGGIAGLLYGSAKNAAVIENCISTGSVLGGSHKGCDMSGGIAGGIGNAIVRSCMSSTIFGPAEALFYNAEQFGAIGAAVGLVFKDSSIEATQAKMDVRTGSAIVYSRGFVGAVAIGAEAKLADCSCSGGPACGNFLPGTVEGKLNAN